MAEMQYWTLEPPRQWRAGDVGGKPFHFDCAGCRAKEPEIAGIISSDGTYAGIGLLRAEGAFVRPAMFCAPCMASRLASK